MAITIRDSITIDSGASITFADNGASAVTIDGARYPLTCNYDRTEVQERIIADMASERGAAFIETVRTKDIRGQRRTWRQIGV